MNDIPRQKLIELLAQYGPSLISDRQKCVGLLWDFCGAYKKELNILKMTLEYGVPDGIQFMIVKPTALPKEIFLARLGKHLMDNLAMTEEAAQWTVETWALALKYVTPNELAGSKNPLIPTPPVKLPDPLPISTPNGPVLNVSRLGMGQFKSISEAILAAAPGTKIIVKPGLYKETLTIDKPLEIVGDGQMEEIVVENNPPLMLLSSQVKTQNIEMRGNIDLNLKKGVLVLESCHLKGGIAIQGDMTLLQIKKSKIDSISNSARDQSKIVVEDSEVGSIKLFGGNFSSFQKTAIFVMSIGDPYKTILAEADIKKNSPHLDQCKIFFLEIREGKPQFINCTFTGKEIDDQGTIKCATISQDGAGIFVNCDFFGHRGSDRGDIPAISVEGKGISEFRKCKFHNPLPPNYQYNFLKRDAKAIGICFGEDAEGIMEDCEIYMNEIGIEIKRGANPIIRKCTVGQNKFIGIWVHDNGAGLVEDCNLKGNGQAWKIEPGCPVQRMNNVE